MVISRHVKLKLLFSNSLGSTGESRAATCPESVPKGKAIVTQWEIWGNQQGTRH